MRFRKLPLARMGLEDMPAVPFRVRGLLKTLLKLNIRAEEFKQATHGLSNVYTIGGVTAPAYRFLFGEADASQEDEEKPGCLAAIRNLVNKMLGGAGDAAASVANHRADRTAAARKQLLKMLVERPDTIMTDFMHQKVGSTDHQPLVPTEPPEVTGLSLEDPKQFAMTWTTFGGTYRDALPNLDAWASTLTDADQASRLFWPLVSGHGLAFNLLFLEKLSSRNLNETKSRFGDAWGADWGAAVEEGLLYAIDLTIFDSLEPQETDGFQRFTPGILVLLRRDPESKELTPVAVRVSGHGGDGARIFVRGQATDGAWLFALQAAKTAITVYGIWLGHVYHWHIVPAAMQMTMLDTFDDEHPIRQLLAPQSKYLIEFDAVLLLLWESIAPPTSLISAAQFLELMNTFAKGRSYFDDDPHTTLERLGLRQEDFTVDEPWDRYPTVRQLLAVWEATGDYVEVFVEETYAGDAAVAADQRLAEWIERSSDRDQGNVRGLPDMDGREDLRRVLHSLIFRVTIHGCARLGPALNPGKTFVANFPPCLHGSEIPEPTTEIDTDQLLKRLPTTRVLGHMMTFYYIFLYSTPYESFVPIDGIEDNLFFPGGKSEPRNRALIAWRRAIIDFMTDFEGGAPQINQWPLNVET